MRPLEVALVLVVVVSACSVFAKRVSRGLLAALVVLDIAILSAHALFEGPHWQMLPAYLAVILFTAIVAAPSVLFRRIAAAGMLLLAVATCAASAVMPMFRLPKPTGPYLIGTRILHLVDSQRLESVSGSPQKARELMVQVWYPAAPSHQPYAPYRLRSETTLLSSYQSVLATHSRWNAPVVSAGAGFPVILFNPAWTGRRTQNIFLVEDLASHGYVVVGIDHTGNSSPIAFPDGHVETTVYVPQMDFATNSLEEIEAEGERESNRQTADDIFVLNQLEKMNADPASPFYRRLDTEHVGALGHSFGGSVAAQASLDDSRIRSALDLDGSLWGEVQRKGLPKPFMMITEDGATYPPELLKQSNELRIDDALDKSDAAMIRMYGGYRVVLHGSTHTSFTDHNLLSPFKSLSGVGTIPAGREYAIIRDYALAFFDKTLRGQDPPLLHQTGSPIPEAFVEIIPPGKDRQSAAQAASATASPSAAH